MPSLFFGVGYDGAGRSMAISALSENRLEWKPIGGSRPGDGFPPNTPAAAL